MPYIICLAGPEAEATALGRSLCAQLETLGRKAGLILPSAEAPAPLDATGPSAELSWGPGGASLRRAAADAPGLEELAGLFLSRMDVVISLAGLSEKRFKLELAAPGAGLTLAGDPGLKAVISSQPVEGAPRVFAPDDLAGLAAWLDAEALPSKDIKRARVLIQGRSLPIKGFVQDIIARTIRAMIASLRGGDKPGHMAVFIDEGFGEP